MSAFPTKIEGYSPTEMRLAWSDGTEFAVPYTELRFQCPCANCVDEHTGQRTIQRSDVKADVKPTGVSIVGRYAAQIRWNDGHETGIYHFDRLYDLCRNHGKAVR